ncbi:hypothetical protein BWI17_14720 [Betaproteobacteria bacterium GR16-43]|nr:hypothetical protein BWI17_14720 [Betaproteobacteria bacterium GR16-43]
MNMKRVIRAVALPLLLAAGPALAQSVLWQTSFAARLPTSTTATSVAFDGAGNVVATGKTWGFYIPDCLTIKYAAATGAQLWLAEFSGGQDSFDKDCFVATDAAGDVFLASRRGAEFAMAKYAGATGALLWESTTSGAPVSSSGRVTGIAVDPSGSPVLFGTRFAASAGRIRAVKFASATGAIAWDFIDMFDTGFATSLATDAAGNVFVAGAHGSEAVLLKLSAASGTLIWGKTYAGVDQEIEFHTAVAVDAGGNAIVTGVTTAVSAVTPSPARNFKTFKYAAADGAILWEKTYDTPGTMTDDTPGFLSLDAAGNAYVVGYANGNYPNIAVFKAIKYANADGAVLWESAGPEVASMSARAVRIAGDGHLVVAGTSGPGSGGYDIRTIKLDGSNGTLRWDRAYAGRAGKDDITRALTVAPDGGAVIAGGTRGGDSLDDFLLIRYTAAGTESWQATAPERTIPTETAPAKIVADAAGDLFVTGWYGNYSTGLGDNDEILTLKLSGTTGAVLWSHVYNGLGEDGPTDMAVDAAGNLFVTGWTTAANGKKDIRTAKHSGATGQVLWTAFFNGPSNDNDEGYRVAVDAAGDVIMSGRSVKDGSTARKTIKYAGASGTLLWQSPYDGYGADDVLVLDAAGNAIVAGYAYDSGTGLSSTRIIKQASANGAILWERLIPGGYQANLAIDASGNVIVSTSHFADPVFSYRALKLAAANGATVWDMIVPGPSGSYANGGPVRVDASGNVLVTGMIQFPGPVGGGYLRTLKLAAAGGAILWDRSENYVTGVYESVYDPGVALDAAGNLLVSSNLSLRKYSGATGQRLWTFTDNGAGFYNVAVAGGSVFGAREWNDPVSGGAIHAVKLVNGSALPVALDLDADGHADLFFRHTDGRAAVWLMNGVAPTATAEILGPGTGWNATHAADFNGDGKADFVWQHPDGRMAVWLMNGTTPLATQQLLNAGAGWTVTHATDLNGDGKADLVFHHTDGRTAAWIMNGTAMTGGATLMGPGLGWSVVKAGDFDGDGRTDLVWAHTDGRVAIWLMDGTTVKATNQILNAGSGWSPAHVADLNGDGKADIVWQHTDGSVALWLMSGTGLASGAGILGAGSGWSVSRTADFDGDGKADLFFEHTDGRAAIWLMNGLTPTATTQILNAGGGWTLAGTPDLNGDGKADLAWRNSDGRIAVWLMSGTTMTGGSGILGPGSGWSLMP